MNDVKTLLLQKRFRPVYFAIGFVLIVVVLFWFYNRFIVFNVVSRTKNPTSLTNIYQFTFNRDLAAISADEAKNKITTSNNLDKIVKVEGKKLNIYLATPAQPSDEFTISLKDIESKGGDKYSNQFTYKIGYKDTKDLSKEELKAGTERSDSFESDYPLIKKLPLIGTDYEISSEFPDSNNYKMPILIRCLTATPRPTTIQGDDIPLSTNDPFVLQYANEIRSCRQGAKKALAEVGYDDKMYTLKCAENILLQEFACSFDSGDTYESQE